MPAELTWNGTGMVLAVQPQGRTGILNFSGFPAISCAVEP
jgi:hypothetical protein